MGRVAGGTDLEEVEVTLLRPRGCNSEPRGMAGPAKAGERGDTGGCFAAEVLGPFVDDGELSSASREREDEVGEWLSEDGGTSGVSSRGGRVGDVRS